MFRPFSDEQARTLINLSQHYAVWIAAEQALQDLPYDLRRKTVSGRDYLYEIRDRSGNGRSLGPWSDELEARFDAYRAAKAEAKERREISASTLDESSRLYRALRLPMIASEAATILREADRRRLLGTDLLLVGTNALPAYAIEAAGFLDAPTETQDLDFAWTAVGDEPHGDKVWPMLKAVDATFTVNTERPFQARNAAAYEVELLIAPSRTGSLARTDQPRPVAMPEQEWLLRGRPVDQVVVGRDGSPARIVAPDPRWFALQKLWLADQPKRNPL
ncbi:MAG TPA: GSU2403 family nucleotidyltransferase fold protein, partial [Allosphingosinicella sp.]|nr:GSU2403 family nucleotidyltransferase fold protein [Allosphingosinicella sp.]